MIISDIIPFPIRCGHRNFLAVKVETECGLYGWGESGVVGRELAVIGAIEHFKKFVIGKDARRIGAIAQEMYRGGYMEGGRVLSGAIAAIDIALWDIAGKRFDVPTYELLGGAHRDHIPCFATSTAAGTESVLEDVQKHVDMGWSVIRLTTGETGTESDAATYDVRKNIVERTETLIAIRERFGHELVLGIDMHHRMTVPEAASFCQKLPDGTLDFLEEPIRQQTPGAYQALRRMTNIPFAIGEEWCNKWHFLPYIENDITNFARIDVCNVGGLTEAMKVAAMAESHYIDVMPHDPLGPICTAATIQMCAAIPNLAWTEIAPYTTDESDMRKFFTGVPVEERCVLKLNDKPGLGIDVNEELVKDQEFEFWEPPRRYKPDGSYTNW